MSADELRRGDGADGFADDDDRARSIAYLDGLLSQDEQLAFEQRLAADPKLAARVQALLETDEWLREEQRELARSAEFAASSNTPPRRPPPAPKTWLWAASFAAAAALVLWAAASWLQREDASSFEVALAPSFEAARDYAASEPRLAGLSAPGVETLRGGESADNIDPLRFVELAREAELERHRARLAGGGGARESELEAPFFVVSVQLAAPSSVVVASIADGRAPERLYPDPNASAAATELAAGVHVLPGERFVLAGSGASTRVRYQRGFLAPVGVGELQVVVGVKPFAAAAELAPTPAELAATDARELEAALRAAGFETRTFVVREPR
jgi:hypothetical protein